jgi:hypothetical protein
LLSLTGLGRPVAFAAGRLFLFSFASAIRHGGASLRGAARAIFRTFIKVEKIA